MERPPPRRSRPPPNHSRPRRGGRGRPHPPPPPTLVRNSSRPKNRRRRTDRDRPPPIPSVTIKLIVRRLPPMLTAKQFADVADPLGAAAAIWRSFNPGSASIAPGLKKIHQVNRHSAAYLGFASWKDAVAFSDAFDGYRFEEEKEPPGLFIARVERAMSQAVPNPNRKPKPLPIEGTIENDTDYLAFVKRLEEESKRDSSRPGPTLPAPSTIMSKMSGTDGDTKGKGKGSNHPEVVTPLMQDVRSRRKERDQKKKPHKSTPRLARKGRPIVTDPASKAQPHLKSSPVPVRGKKHRRADFSTPPKKNTDVIIAKKHVRGPANGRRSGVQNHGQREEWDHKPQNGSVNNNVNVSPRFSGTVEHNGYVSDKRGVGRGGRLRAGRGGRVQGKPGSAFGGNGHHQVRIAARSPPDMLHGPVRLLKKETSNGNKT